MSGIALTRFELLTAAAFLHFSDEGVDVAVIEVGMGGTWDSTNVIDGSVAVLTNVDLDHTAVLGTTIAAIASDKVGIFRADAIAIVATTNAVVVEIAQRRADELGADLWLLGDTFALEQNELALGGRAISLRTPFTHYEEVLVSLHGIHQGVNAATAIVAAEAFLGRALGEEIVTSTLAQARMPGRMELISRKPMIVIDGAHNPGRREGARRDARRCLPRRGGAALRARHAEPVATSTTWSNRSSRSASPSSTVARRTHRERFPRARSRTRCVATAASPTNTPARSRRWRTRASVPLTKT